MLDNDGSNFAYTMQMIQNVIDQENNVSDPKVDSPVDLVVLMGNSVDPDFQSEYQTYFQYAVTYL